MNNVGEDQMMKKITWINFLFLWVATCLFGYPPSYGPFADGKSPQKVALKQWVMTKQEDLQGQEASPSIVCFVESEGSAGPMVRLRRIEHPNGDKWEIKVIDRNGTPISDPATNDMPTCYIRVFAVDLNQDGVPDFMVNIWSDGCGLAATGSTHTFLLSEKGRFKATSFYSHDFGAEDIIRLKPDGPWYYIQNDLLGNGDEKTRDGRDHSFWVYQLYRFSGGKMVESNKDDARFPKWIWYTYKANHKETDQLTAEQKKRIMEGK